MPSFSSHPSLNRLRNRLRHRRRQLDVRARARAAEAAARVALTLPAFRHARRIAFYLAHGGELDPLPLMVRARAMGKRCYLPVLHPCGHRRLWFAPWQPGEPLVDNRFGIGEPRWQRTGMLQARHLDLILLPLVAFDDHCTRLGMGGGYYDRTLAWRLRPTPRGRPLLAGFAYGFQKVERLPRQPWDVPLDLVITDQGVVRCCHEPPRP